MAETVTSTPGVFSPDIQKRLLELEKSIQGLEAQFKGNGPKTSAPVTRNNPPISYRHLEWLKIATKVSVISLAVIAGLVVLMFAVQTGISGMGGLDQLVNLPELNTIMKSWG